MTTQTTLTDKQELKARQESFKQMPQNIVIYADAREEKPKEDNNNHNHHCERCKKKQSFKYYHGFLGYESFVCSVCNWDINDKGEVSK